MFSSLEPGRPCGSRVSEDDEVMSTALAPVGWVPLLHLIPHLFPHSRLSVVTQLIVRIIYKIHSFINDNAF